MTQMKLLGKTFRLALLFIIATELLSFLAKYLELWAVSEIFQKTIYLLLIISIFVVSLQKLEYGFYAGLVEILIGAKGHLFYFKIDDWQLSIRVGIFIVLILAWLIYVIRQKKSNIFTSFNVFWLIILALFICWGTVWGWLRGNSAANVFFDVNAWLFFGYLGIFVDVIVSNKTIGQILSLICAAITWISVKTLGLLFIFSHSTIFPKYIYQWVRDTGVGEITLLDGNFFRIFFQSHIYLLIGFCVLGGYLIFKGKINWQDKQNWFMAAILTISMSGIIISLSRSNWLGLVAAIFVFYLLMIFWQHFGWKKIVKISAGLLLLTFVSVLILGAVMYFPYPQPIFADTAQMVKDRLSQDEAAASSRLNQLIPLVKAISIHPIVGSGWASQVTYESQDPRILKQYEDGKYTTYAFEWGYLDIVLKIGLAGLIVYLIIIFNLAKQSGRLLKSSLENSSKALLVGFILGLVALAVTHCFSPYLNHPLGIGYLLLMIAVITFYSKMTLALSGQKVK